MKKLFLLLLALFVCSMGIAVPVGGVLDESPSVATATGSSRPGTTNRTLVLHKYNATLVQEKKTQYYYDNSEIVYSIPMPPELKVLSYIKFTWQLTSVHGRVLARGKVNWQRGKKIAKVPLKFDKLKPGIKLKCLLQIKLNKEILVKQPLEIYSKQIFADIAGRLKKLGAGAILPENEIERLNRLGLGLPVKSLDGFENPANKVIFCAAKEYADNIGMLQELMQRGVTLVMFAPDDKSEIFVPLGKMAKTTIVATNSAKSNGGLGIIYSKEKIVIGCDSGQGGLVEIKYQTGKIIIVADAMYKNLDKTPEPALMLKQQIEKEIVF
jgi:hypothetical protein